MQVCACNICKRAYSHLDRALGRCKKLNRTVVLSSRGGGAPPDRESFDVLRKDHVFTSESVSEGHPDKVCDQISDAILDAFIDNDVRLGIADDSLVNTR